MSFSIEKWYPNILMKKPKIFNTLYEQMKQRTGLQSLEMEKLNVKLKEAMLAAKVNESEDSGIKSQANVSQAVSEPEFTCIAEYNRVG